MRQTLHEPEMNSIIKTRLITGSSALLLFLAVLQLRKVLTAAEVMGVRFWQIGVSVVEILMAVAVAGLAVITFSKLAYLLSKQTQKIGEWFSRHKLFIIILVVLDAFFLVFITFGKYYRYQTGWFVQGLIIWLSGLMAGLLLTSGWPKRGLLFWLAAGFTSVGFLLQAGVIFSQVTDYPFSQTWSEGMIFFNAAQIAGIKVWGYPVGWPTINPSLAILQSLPFFLPGNLPLLIHRLWNSILWVIFPLLMALVLIKRVGLSDLLPRLIVIFWVFSFLNQAPVYFNLLVIPIIIFLGFRPRSFWKTFVVILLASIWAGLSRLNWYPMAGLLASFVYLLEVPYEGKFWRYFWKPIVWVGSSVGISLVTNRIFLIVTGQSSIFSQTALQSPLLWERLMPTATNPIGILPGLLIVSSGMLVLVGWKVLAWNGLHIWRRFAIFAIFLVTGLGGLVVSTKIGGGNNLHNLDAFFVLLIICGVYFICRKITPENQQVHWQKIPMWLLAWIIILPIVSQMLYIPFRVPITPVKIADLNTEVNEKIAKAQATGKPILFISQTQMLAINRYPGILPEPKYEMVWMMEMAMSENEPYFQQFYAQLAEHKWSLIIIDTLTEKYADEEKAFGEEQNVWMRWVVSQVNKYYTYVGGNEYVLAIAAPR